MLLFQNNKNQTLHLNYQASRSDPKKSSKFLHMEGWLSYSTQPAKRATWASEWEDLDKVGKLHEMRISVM